MRYISFMGSVQFLLVLECLVLGGSIKESFGQTVIPLANGKQFVAAAPPTQCYNLATYPIDVCYTHFGQTASGAPPSSTAAGGMPFKDFFSNPGSFVPPDDLNYHHHALDYWPGEPGGGCTSCNGGSPLPGTQLTNLFIERRHRYRDQMAVSSFGPAVFCNYDVTLQFLPTYVNTGPSPGVFYQIELFDPSEVEPRFLSDGIYGDAVKNGIFQGDAGLWLKEIRILDSNNNLVSDPQAAAKAVLTNWAGVKYTFDVINLDQPVPATKVAWWKFDEGSGATASDSSGNGNTGTLLNNPTWGPGESGTALSFDGATNYVTVGNPADLNFNGPITVGAWVYLNDPTSNQMVITHGVDTGYSEFGPTSSYFTLYVDSGYMNLDVYDSTIGGGEGQMGTRGNIGFQLNDAQDVGAWVHWAVTCDGSKFTMYRNGIQVASSAFTLLAPLVYDNWTIGADSTASQYFFNGKLDEIQIFNTALNASQIATMGQSKTLAGRLTGITDRNGYTVALAYKSFTADQLTQSPDLQWQIDTVTDPYGRQAAFTYLPAQQSGRWAVGQIDFPNGHKAVYGYTNGLLSTVAFDDGTQSTIDFGTDATSQTTTVHFHDVAATGTSRDKTAYLTNNFTYGYLGSSPDRLLLFNQSSLLVRMVANGSGEITYMNACDTSGDALAIYNGAGQMVFDPGGSQHFIRMFYVDGWTAPQPSMGRLGIGGTMEASPYYSLIGMGPALNSYRTPDGITYNLTLDGDTFPTTKTYADNTTETWAYNQFKQPLRHQDRNGNVTLFTYDANGNMLTKEVGIKSVGGVDTQQPEYGKYQWTYYPSGSANQFLMSSFIDANGNTTSYVYDNNHRLTEVIEPPDAQGDAQATTIWTYDTVGRIQEVTDPVNRTVQYVYDERDRVIKIIYADSSTERFIYGAQGSGNENLLVKQKDRNGVVTKFDYDAAGRCNLTTYAYSTMDLTDNETMITDPSVQVTKSCTFLDGTDLLASCTERGETTTYGYDYRQRLVSTTVQPRAGVTLTSTKTYLNNQLFRETDPYGRSRYYGYRTSDGALIRTIQGTVPSFTLADFTAVMNEARDQTPNATFLITDFTLDNNGQEVAIIDGRNTTTAQTFDSRGQLAQRVEATGTPVAATTAWLYDANGNQVEVRTPRYFDSSDPQVGNCRTTLVYTGRNLLKSKTEAPGTSVAATVQYAYNLDRTQATTIDGRNYTWTTLWSPCCAGRVTSQQDPAAGATSTDYDYAGDITFTQVVQGTTTYNATTTLFDARRRPLFRTVWLTTPPAVDPNNPPIAGQNGVPAADGLTTQWHYDENLADDVGLSSAAGQSIAGVGNVSIQPLLVDIQADGITFGAGSDGYAVLEIKPDGELAVTIQDGAHRKIASGVIQPPTTQTPNQPIAWHATLHDTVATVSSPGNLVETSHIDALGNTTRTRIDGEGRIIQSLDAESNITVGMFDANSNQLSVSDANSVGYTAVFDARDRETSRTDTMNAQTQTAYDANSNIVKVIDAKNNNSTAIFDARDRRASVTDRIGGTTSWGYDANSNIISLTDSESNTTQFAFDSRNLKITETYADHSPPAVNDQVAFAYDGAKRLQTRTDQLGDYVTMVYDMANRLAARQYRDHTKLSTDSPNDTDSFAYDAGGHLLAASSGRYSNTISFTYDPAGRLAGETLTIGGQAYTVGRGYDAANRLTSITYPDGSVVAHTFTSRNLLQQINYNNAMVASFAYDAGGRRATRELGDTAGTTTTWGYIAGGDLTASINTPNLPSFTYTYDANKNKTAETITGALSPYGFSTGVSGYDNEDRLTNWNRSDTVKSQSWTLTKAGDWQQLVDSGVTHTRTHNAVHELLSDNSLSLSYDAKGNLIADAATSRSYVWDFDNHLSQATAPGSTTDASYDALGRRVTRTVNGSTLVFVDAISSIDRQLGGVRLVEYPWGGPPVSPTCKYVYGSMVDELLLYDIAGTIRYYHGNAQNSPVAITGADGTVSECYAYTPYGGVTIYAPDGVTIRTATAVGNVVAFTGRPLDFESSVYYFRARYLDPQLGRFASRDPIGYNDGQNLYAAGFALNGIDPSGTVKRKVKCRKGWTLISAPSDDPNIVGPWEKYQTWYGWPVTSGFYGFVREGLTFEWKRAPGLPEIRLNCGVGGVMGVNGQISNEETWTFDYGLNFQILENFGDSFQVGNGITTGNQTGSYGEMTFGGRFGNVCYEYYGVPLAEWVKLIEERKFQGKIISRKVLKEGWMALGLLVCGKQCCCPTLPAGGYNDLAGFGQK